MRDSLRYSSLPTLGHQQWWSFLCNQYGSDNKLPYIEIHVFSSLNTLLSLCRSRGYIKTDNLKAYLHVLLKNNAINHCRHKIVEHKYLEHTFHFRNQFSLNGHTPRAEMETKELQNQIKSSHRFLNSVAGYSC